jgi:hypothetical protein
MNRACQEAPLKTITVYDPPMCCATGVCGPTVDPKIVQFAGDLEWLKTQGVSVKRYNLAQEPERFVENSDIKSILERSGDEELPAILAGADLVSSGCFPDRLALSEMAGLEVTGGDLKATASSESSCCGTTNSSCC